MGTKVRMALNCRERQSERLGLRDSPLPGRLVLASAEKMPSGFFYSQLQGLGLPSLCFLRFSTFPFNFSRGICPFESLDPCSGSSWGRQSPRGLISGAGTVDSENLGGQVLMMAAQEPWLSRHPRHPSALLPGYRAQC